MSNDVEMNEVKNLMEAEPVKEHDDLKVPEVEIKSSKPDEEFTGLTKEELEKYAKDPFWRKLRLVLFILFWLVWLGMLVTAILIVVLSPKCPKRPALEFWQKKTGYWVDTLAYVDSNGDGVGDFEGLISRLDYIHVELGAGYIVLDPVFAGQYTNDVNMIGSVNSFRELDPAVGNRDSFKKLLKECRKRGLEIVLAVDFNALASSSVFLQNSENATMKWDDKMQNWLSRDGKSPKRIFKSRQVYSSAPEKSTMIDLNLKNSAVLTEIKESVKMWLDLGVRGLLLTNVAFYTENTTIPAIPTNYAHTNKWYRTVSMNGQIFALDTIDFLKEIRTIMDEVAKSSDKSRLLIVDAGNVGYGLTQSNKPDDMLQYLGDINKVADMVIGREFLLNRGWNIDDAALSRSSVIKYLQSTVDTLRNRVLLTSATSTSLRTNSLQKLAAPFLLPGNPILYFGSEIGAECSKANINSLTLPFYPKNKLFPLADVDSELPTKCNHMIMPWDNSGNVFFNKKMNATNPYIETSNNTVQGFTAVGKGETILNLHQKLIKVRKDPSLQWGNIEMFYERKTAMSSYEIFVRQAEGFPKIIVALIKDTIDGKVFSFSSICDEVIPLLVYPTNVHLPETEKIKADNIYLNIGGTESVHVFQCASK